MLEVCVKIFNSLLISTTSLYVIKKIVQSDDKILTIKNVCLLFLLSIITTILYKTEYKGAITVIIFMINILIYKNIVQMTIEESIISNCLLILIIFSCDLVTSIILRNFYNINELRNNIGLLMISNALVSTFAYLTIRIKFIQRQLQKFYINIKKKKSITNAIFLLLLVISFCCTAYNITRSYNLDISYITNTLVMMIFIAIAYMFIKSKNNYNELIDNYDSLFNYVQNFEDWIEKEQLNRHEYKNQLAVIRCLTKEKKVKDKIDEILEDNINIEGSVVSKLKFLPKGGIKGLMYYKAAIAQKKKINLTVDVDLESKSILNNLSEQDVRVICKLIGIYFDNAIEAAAETRKKSVLLEVYEIKDKVTIVLSNTFKKHDNFKDRNKKGVSSKGEGHGNGLYFASKLISSNKWLDTKQEIIDNYYIQQLIIYDKKKSK